MNDKIAIIVLCYNQQNVTKQFLDALYKHTPLDRFCLYVIDNGSTDSTVDMVESFIEDNGIDNLILKKNHKNDGVVKGRNYGFDWYLSEACKDCGRLMFIDNDQFVQENWLDNYNLLFRSGYHVVGVEAWQMNRQFMPIQKNTHSRQWFTYVGCGGMMMDKEVPQTIGKFDERFNPCYFEDPDYCFRAYRNKFKIGWNYDAKIIHLPHQTLGKNKDKRVKFESSLKKFRDKWKSFSKRKPHLHQVRLDRFSL